MEISFIIIDDNELDCFIARKIIAHTDRNIATDVFHDAQHALESISANTSYHPGHTTIVLLDIRMPLMNGFEFIEAFEKLSPDIHRQYKIKVLSSTRNMRDILRLRAYRTVDGILEKPLSREIVSRLVDDVRMGGLHIQESSF